MRSAVLYWRYMSTTLEHHWLDSLNIKKQCAEYRVGLWQCPQFLFLVMGIVIIMAVVATNIVARRYTAPEISALIILALSGFLFVVGHLIVSAFGRVARSARSKSEFISIISHHLRSPLSAIKWQLDILLSQDFLGDRESSNNARRYLRVIVDNNERMIRAVNDLLDINRIEDGDMVMRPDVFSLVDISRTAVVRFSQMYPSHSFSLRVETEDVARMRVYADEERIRRVLQHLMENALRYSNDGGAIVVGIKREGEKVRWSVTDDGIGIPLSDQPRVFEKFFRTSSSARHQTEGLGVGLFVAQSLIALSHGTIGFSSTPGKGSTFWFTLPVAK